MNDDKTQKIANSSWIKLVDGESVQDWAHPSIYRYLPGFLTGIIVAIIGSTIPFMIGFSAIKIAISLLLIFVGIIVFFVEYLLYANIFYVITNKRIFRKKGVLDHTTNDIRYQNIEKINKEISLTGRILNFGTLNIETASSEGTDLSLTDFPNWSEAYDKVNTYRENE